MELIRLIIKNDPQHLIEIYDLNWIINHKKEKDRIIKTITFFQAIEIYYKKNNIKIKEIIIETRIRYIHHYFINLIKQSDTNIIDKFNNVIHKKIQLNLPFQAQILIPYRANNENIFRKEQMTRFLLHMKKYMFIVNPNVNYKFIILEQDNDNLFNRGLLLNIGYLECEKKTSKYIKYYIHHNVDLFPKINCKIKLDYSYTPIGEIRDIYGYIGGLGGICILNKHDFKLINGFPNNCVKWGQEDVIIKQRCERNNIIINRKTYNKEITEEIHERDSSFHKLNIFNTKNDNINWKNNGLSTCNYSVKINLNSEFNYENIVHYVINFN